jgi:hypothetical protein
MTSEWHSTDCYTPYTSDNTREFLRSALSIMFTNYYGAFCLCLCLFSYITVFGHNILGVQLRQPLTFGHQVYEPASYMVTHDIITVLREVQAVVPNLVTTFFIGHAMIGHDSMKVKDVAVGCISSPCSIRELCNEIQFAEL